MKFSAEWDRPLYGGGLRAGVGDDLFVLIDAGDGLVRDGGGLGGVVHGGGEGGGGDGVVGGEGAVEDGVCQFDGFLAEFFEEAELGALAEEK